jgi:DNA polymerase-3 subunit beta
MNGFYIELEDGCVNIMASNGHTLALTRQQLANYDTKRIGSFIMPRKPATLLMALAALTDEDDSVFMEWNDKKAKIEMSTFTMILCQPEAKYPNYRAVIRQSSPHTAKIDKETMIKAVKKVVPFSNSSSQLIMLNFSNGSLNITADDFDFSRGSSDKISIEYDDVDMAIGTKGDSILSLLSKLNNPQVTMEFAQPDLSMLFKDQDGDAEITMLLMPMLIN